MTSLHIVIVILAITIATASLRYLPFFIFPEHKKTPKFIAYLGDVLPLTTIGMLVVYCLKDISFIAYPYGLAEIISIILIVILHLWKKNTLISIGAGTLFYMFLIQMVF